MYKKLIIFGIIFIICAGVVFASSFEEANKLNEEGNKLIDQSDYKGALAKYEKALKIFREDNDESNIGCALGNIGNVYNYLGNYSKALEYYNKALEIARKIGDVSGEGRHVGSIGNVYDHLGDYPKALEYDNQALEIARKIGDVNNEGIWLGNIGNVYLALGDYSKALEYYNKALEIARKIGDVSGEGIRLAKIGIVYYNLGDYPKALEYDNQALEILRKIGDVSGEGRHLGNIGYVYYNLGDYLKALEYYNKALEIARKIGDVSGEGAWLGSIGNVYLALGDYPKALEYYNKALEIARKIGTVNNEGIWLGNIGNVYLALGDYPKALEYYNKALEIKKKIGVPYDWYEKSIGDVYFEQGNLDKASEIYNKLGWSIPLGRYYLVKKDYTKAKEKFTGILEKVEKQREATSLLSTYIGLGLSEEGLKNYQEAEKYYKKAVDFIEHQRDSLPQSARKNFFDVKIGGFSKLEPYEGLCRIYHYLNRDSDGLYYSESTKARLLSEEIAKKYEGTDCTIPPEIATKERELVNGIASIYKQMEVAYEKNNQGRLKQLETELTPLKAELDKFISKLWKDFPEYASIMYPKPLKIEEIKLNPGEVLIEYEVTDKKTIAYLIKGGKIVKTISIDISREDLSTFIKVYRGVFENVKDYSDLSGFSPQTGKKLYDLLLKDLLSEVKGEKIIIVPDGILGLVPFESLIMDLPSNVKIKQTPFGPYPEGVKYVGDVYSISYYQSVSALSIIRNLNKGGGKKGIFAVADPVFGKDDERLTGMANINPMTDIEILRMGAIQNEGVIDFRRLKLTGDMEKGLERLFPGEIEALTGMNATEKTVKSKDLSGYKYLVFATHGILDDDVPYIKEPALVLTLVNKGNEDGFLTMGEVMNMKMGANVAVLSACKTGLGRNVRGEGVMGMGRAFQYAGVKSVLMSLWSVESESTNMMTEKFFEGLKQGKSNRDALKDARAYIRSKGYEHPYFWAPFILVGD